MQVAGRGRPSKIAGMREENWFDYATFTAQSGPRAAGDDRVPNIRDDDEPPSGRARRPGLPAERLPPATPYEPSAYAKIEAPPLRAAVLAWFRTLTEAQIIDWIKRQPRRRLLIVEQWFGFGDCSCPVMLAPCQRHPDGCHCPILDLDHGIIRALPCLNHARDPGDCLPRAAQLALLQAIYPTPGRRAKGRAWDSQYADPPPPKPTAATDRHTRAVDVLPARHARGRHLYTAGDRELADHLALAGPKLRCGHVGATTTIPAKADLLTCHYCRSTASASPSQAHTWENQHGQGSTSSVDRETRLRIEEEEEIETACYCAACQAANINGHWICHACAVTLAGCTRSIVA
jgi:hypothetical protein